MQKVYSKHKNCFRVISVCLAVYLTHAFVLVSLIVSFESYCGSYNNVGSGKFGRNELNVINKQGGLPWAPLISKRLHGKAIQVKVTEIVFPIFWETLECAAAPHEILFNLKQTVNLYSGVYKRYRMLNVFLI